MSLRALRTLHAIAQHGSFARAGEVVGLTQSAVSLQVKMLEEEFGARLFDRSRRLPRLTEAGRIVLEKSAEVLALYDQIASALSDEQSLAGRLRLGAVQTALSGVLPEALAALNQSHPRVRVHVSAGMSAELALRIAAGELDAAVTTEPVRPHPPDLVWTPLYEDRFWLIAPPGHDARSPRELLSELPFIRFDSHAWAGRVIDRELRRMRLDVREEMVLDSLEVILRMVEKGLGVAVVPLSDDVLATLRLTTLPFGEPQLIRRIVLLERQDCTGGRLSAALAQAVMDIKKGAVPG
ncbi:LysR family transcriptional regulator [Methylobacterium nodulans]|uniref:Transcriptional regulator, LysR family n=1 Tax=Methylobacterium nodulans (strain LMG 21967 / CNCM I-2342 / ORS 2060) TaxID=460265 RepID=B8IGB3_METNO|nr:LysR family transcriptional regulator [Methylobacterium nodulans]ACL61590.1 transcriptional regulator, LysR family [Methylobacterium nodulans ORS 2060]